MHHPSAKYISKGAMSTKSEHSKVKEEALVKDATKERQTKL